MIRSSLLLLLLLLLLSGCAWPVSDECRSYVACQTAIDATVDVSDYEEGGSCWAQAAVAFSCTEQCKEAIEALRATPRPPDLCAAPPG